MCPIILSHHSVEQGRRLHNKLTAYVEVSLENVYICVISRHAFPISYIIYFRYGKSSNDKPIP